MFYTSKKELTSFPFDELFNMVDGRVRTTLHNVMQDAKKAHLLDLKRRYEVLGKEVPDNVLDEFPFDGIDEATRDKAVALAKKEGVTAFLEKYEVKKNADWLMPQLFAYIARMPIERNSSGKYCPIKFRELFKKDLFHKGIYLLATHPVRGDMIAKQYLGDMRSYAALVPLLLAPFKKFDNIQYSDWDINGLDKIIDPTLWQVMNLDINLSDFSADELLSVRQVGLTVKSGKKEGTLNNPVSTHRLYGLPSAFTKLPWLSHSILFQIWVGHPNNRNNLMILDFKDWDRMPDPLIEPNVIKPSAPATTVLEGYGWE